MPFDLCVKMPFLHSSLADAPACAESFIKSRRLWPGMAGMDAGAYWLPPRLPLSEKEAGAALASLKGQTVFDLERPLALIRQGAREEERRFRSEMAALENFMKGIESPPSLDEELTQAQLNLLWIWLLEEEFLEIASLSAKCAAAEAGLMARALDFSESAETHASPSLAPAKELLPDWKKVFLNAAYFIDSDLPVLLEGSMREDLISEFEFKEDEELPGFLRARLPLWLATGLSKPPDSGLKADYWGRPRLFLAEIPGA